MFRSIGRAGLAALTVLALILVLMGVGLYQWGASVGAERGAAEAQAELSRPTSIAEETREVEPAQVAQMQPTTRLPVEEVMATPVPVSTRPAPTNTPQPEVTQATDPLFVLEASESVPNSGQIPVSIVPAQARQFDFDGGNFWVDGGVETAVNIEIAQGEFKNTLGLGTQSWLAEPGKLLVNGFDFDLNAIKNSGGAIDHWNPTNQQIFGWSPPAFWNLNEGGFALAVANRMTIEIPDRATIHVEGDDTTAWLVIMRGLYSDFETPNDRNLNLRIDHYIPGNIMFARFSGTPNGGFVSEGQFQQLAETTQSGFNDCGQSGCPKLFALFFDSNTGAWLVLQRQAPNASWQRVASNMDYLQ